MLNRKPVGRPKIMKRPSTLNLSVDLDIKRKLFAMATEKGCSISALVASMVAQAR